MPIAVVAIGGNSLVKPGERGTLEEQRANLSVTCEGIAAVMAAGYRVVVTHGNGPQVGDALLRSEMAAAAGPPLPWMPAWRKRKPPSGIFCNRSFRKLCNATVCGGRW